MNNFSEKHHRRSLRLSRYDYSQSGAYFVKICIKNSENLLGDIPDNVMNLNQFGQVVKDIWHSLDTRYKEVILDEFVIMPNHIHGIIFIDNPVEIIHELSLLKERRKMLLPKVIGYFKMNSAKLINQLRGTQGQSVWQKNYYEHIIRHEVSLTKIREYIVNNPLKWHQDIENQQVKPSQEEIEFWQNFGRKDL
jgi:REP element-mobilizing transposase RayT